MNESISQIIESDKMVAKNGVSKDDDGFQLAKKTVKATTPRPSQTTQSLNSYQVLSPLPIAIENLAGNLKSRLVDKGKAPATLFPT
jgi:glutamate/tyrosine decarboxylase-like PLP-dependent enzyme